MFNHHEKNIINAFKKVRIHVESEEPCYTLNGTPADGSIFSEKSNSVCISAKTIAEKVHIEEVPKQAAALSLHEYAEVIGLSEEDAVNLQKRALDELN